MNAKTLLSTITAAVTALALAIVPAQAQGFAGLGADVGGFAPVVPGKSLVFPADHGPHPDYRIEWWYFTANLSDANGRQLWRAMDAVSAGGEAGRRGRRLGDAADLDGTRRGHQRHDAPLCRTVCARRRRAGGRRSRAVQGLDRQLEHAQRSSQDFAPLELTASAKDFSYQLKLESDRSVVLQGDAGYSRKSERGQASYYYSQPYLNVSGAIVIDGKSIAVSGRGWIDREWSSQYLGADQTGWDWFSLHLGDGEKLMLFRLRHADGKHFFAGNWIGRDGRSEPLDPQDIVLAPTAVTRVAGRDLPTAWDISIPSRAAESLECSAQPAKLDGHPLQVLGRSDHDQRQPHRASATWR